MAVVLFSAPYMIPFLDRFKPFFERLEIKLIIPDVKERLGEQELLALAGEFDGVICGDDRFTSTVIEACTPRLKVISKWGTGIDSIDQEACRKHGIMIGNTPDAFTKPVSDTVLGYILAFARQLPWMDRAVKRGIWKKIPGRSLSETTLGVVGVGKIGQAVLRRAKAFEMNLLGTDIRIIDSKITREIGVQMVSFEELLSKADFISLNCDLNPTSRGLINEDAFKKMKSEAVLINTSRGPVVDQEALIQALAAKKIGGAGLDVYQEEPLPPESPLLQFDNVLLAPHNANSSPTAWERVHENTIKNLLVGLEMIGPEQEVNFE